MSECIQVLTTVEQKTDAERIARALVDQRLAACVQIAGPIQSIYRWKEQIESATEWQCIIKTRDDLFSSVERAIHELHPYEIPEILAVPATGASAAYRDWLLAQVDN